MENPALRSWLVTVTKGHIDPLATTQHIYDVLHHFPTLRPKYDFYALRQGSSSNGAREPTLSTFGTLPVTYHGQTYQFPVCLYYPVRYPQVPPVVDVVPTADMAVVPGKCVNAQGHVHHPYLSQWEAQPQQKNAVELLRALQIVFSHEPPVGMKHRPRPAQKPTSAAANASMAAGGGGGPLGMGLAGASLSSPDLLASTQSQAAFSSSTSTVAPTALLGQTQPQAHPHLRPASTQPGPPPHSMSMASLYPNTPPAATAHHQHHTSSPLGPARPPHSSQSFHLPSNNHTSPPSAASPHPFSYQHLPATSAAAAGGPPVSSPAWSAASHPTLHVTNPSLTNNNHSSNSSPQNAAPTIHPTSSSAAAPVGGDSRYPHYQQQSGADFAVSPPMHISPFAAMGTPPQPFTSSMSASASASTSVHPQPPVSSPPKLVTSPPQVPPNHPLPPLPSLNGGGAPPPLASATTHPAPPPAAPSSNDPTAATMAHAGSQSTDTMSLAALRHQLSLIDGDPVPPEKRLAGFQIAVYDKLTATLDRFNKDMKLRTAHLLAINQHLNHGEEIVEKEKRLLTTMKRKIDNNIAVLETKHEELKVQQTVISKMPHTTGSGLATPPAESLFRGREPAHEQLFHLVAEDNALEDTIYYLGKALSLGQVELPAYLKSVRALAHDQFLCRALIQTIRQRCNLPPT
ncbi:UEV domain-containing protein [Dimargaris cristalligena]|uniref:UEV domain-containing protein n=1 Tax=Dimargaris cristalligena TaxID=215637 RepID=A0A4P9ZX35_9FUNG|nr:UEV domain-containing protein [Dimargaris cristalligena]|eukprot:RKP37561.1 UEV domain-containing protein [Dimargaris cristalligena]